MDGEIISKIPMGCLINYIFFAFILILDIFILTKLIKKYLNINKHRISFNIENESVIYIIRNSRGWDNIHSLFIILNRINIELLGNSDIDIINDVLVPYNDVESIVVISVGDKVNMSLLLSHLKGFREFIIQSDINSFKLDNMLDDVNNILKEFMRLSNKNDKDIKNIRRIKSLGVFYIKWKTKAA